MPDSHVKDPNDIVDYQVSWAEWLGEVDDTIATSTFLVPDGITEDEGRRANTSTDATIWLSGGMLGETYDITSRITTAGGRQADKTFRVIIRQR
jgi:hypothetical protein